MLGSFLTLSPDWNFQGIRVYSFFSEKADGSSASFRLNTSTGEICRRELDALISPERPIVWMNQVHGKDCIELTEKTLNLLPEADASFTRQNKVVCAVLTADCVPLVYVNPKERVVAAVHAGRKGIEQNLPAQIVSKMGSVSDTYVWIGPGIAAESYQVSTSMRAYFLQLFPEWEYVFEPCGPDQYKMDLYAIVRLQLKASGIPASHISGGQWDTFTNPLLHSARRDAEVSGRLATVVWME